MVSIIMVSPAYNSSTRASTKIGVLDKGDSIKGFFGKEHSKVAHTGATLHSQVNCCLL